jgi:aminomethyltransferase
MAELRTPLFDTHVAAKARMVPFGGWEMPVQYSGVVAEHRAVRSAAGLFDISHMARLEFSGADVLPVLENVFTNVVGTMKVGQVRYGLICNESGGILDDVLVYRWADAYSMVVNASNRETIAAWLRQHAAGHDAQVHDSTFTTGMIAVQGPASVQLMSGLLADDVSGLKYYFAAKSTYRGAACTVSRTGYTGEDGFEVSVPAGLAASLWAELVGRGALPCGLGARDTLRLEAAMPLYGHELNESITPVEAGLSWAVKLDKGPFVGREALRTAPVRKTRVGLKLDGKRAAREGSPVLADSVQVGSVTSGSYVPHLEQSIAMAYVPPGKAAPGTVLSVDLRGTSATATVVPLPFYKRPA